MELGRFSGGGSDGESDAVSDGWLTGGLMEGKELNVAAQNLSEQGPAHAGNQSDDGPGVWIPMRNQGSVFVMTPPDSIYSPPPPSLRHHPM